jgi:transcriptional regulator with XRE-family HTH domain
MARPRTKQESTAFGRFLDGERVDKRGQPVRIDDQISYQEAAEALGLARGYVNQLASGAVLPGRALMFRIEAWARSRGGDVSVRSWGAPTNPPAGRVKRKRA